MTRFDLSKTDRDLINLTVELGFTDAVEIACDFMLHDGNVESVLVGLVDCVASYQHDTDKNEARDRWFDAYNRRMAARRAA